MIEKLKEYMRNNNLKQYELANLLGTNDSQVNRWLNGKSKISRAWKQIIEFRLGIH